MLHAPRCATALRAADRNARDVPTASLVLIENINREAVPTLLTLEAYLAHTISQSMFLLPLVHHTLVPTEHLQIGRTCTVHLHC